MAHNVTQFDDPTIREMRRYLHQFKGMADGELSYWQFAREEAIYWFASHYYGGMWSNLYSALSRSPYRPGPLTRGPSDGLSQELYDMLVDQYTRPAPAGL